MWLGCRIMAMYECGCFTVACAVALLEFRGNLGKGLDAQLGAGLLQAKIPWE
jgi:hypothetical protein